MWPPCPGVQLCCQNCSWSFKIILFQHHQWLPCQHHNCSDWLDPYFLEQRRWKTDAPVKLNRKRRYKLLCRPSKDEIFNKNFLNKEVENYFSIRKAISDREWANEELLLGNHKGKLIRSAILKLKTGKCILTAHKECANFFNNSVASILETISNFDIEA